MSSCYNNSLNLELIKTFSPCSNSSSSTTSPRSILTRKSRTPRKRPNQNYNEAAAILATAYPKIFPLQKTPLKFTNSLLQNRSPPDDLLPVLQVPKTESRVFEKAWEAETRLYNYSEIRDDDFSTESLLDEEIEEGIDSIFIGMKEKQNENENGNDAVYANCWEMQKRDTCCDLEMRAMRHVDEGDWWRFPCVDVAQITQPNDATGLLRLKLDYDAVLKAWSGKAGNHVQVRLAQTDLFPEAEKGAGAVDKKRCARLFPKKPRYQITKLNAAAHQRPRLKGRFVKTANPIDDD